MNPTLPIKVPSSNGLGMDMVWCPRGIFLMGSPESEEVRGVDETQHKVTLTEGFWMAKTPATQRQWQQLMGDNPSDCQASGRDTPVESVSWENAMEFCRKLTGAERTGGNLLPSQEYTLPTEARVERRRQRRKPERSLLKA